MKVIFLDIDGVLNAHYNTKERWHGLIGIDPKHVKLFNQLVEQVGAKVVLSSTWRRRDNWKEIMHEHGLDESIFIGRTDYLGDIRGKEIKKYLDTHPEIKQYAIIDDDSDMLPDQHLFKTRWNVGLTERICEDIVAHFKSENY